MLLSRPLAAPALALIGVACAPIAAAGPGCSPESGGVALPAELSETSGVAFSRRSPGVLWTHNDDGSTLYAIEESGRVRGRFQVRPRLRDWEDLAVADCSMGSCLYFADTGDNAERRPAGDIRLFRAPEPDPTASGRLDGLEAFPIRLPDGPRDVEAMFVLPGERPYLVTKGRNHAITVYRYPPPLRPDTVTLEEVQRLTAGAAFLLDQVTGADATPSGRTIAVRTYQSLSFYRLDADTLARIPNGLVNLRSLEEAQGEAVAVAPDGRVALTSEGGPFGAAPSLHLLQCELPTL